jgi:hypothetical protein
MSNHEEKKEIDEYNESYNVKPQYTEDEKNNDLEETEDEKEDTIETIEYKKTKKGKVDGRSKRKGLERTEKQKKAFENMILKKQEKAQQKKENIIKEKAVEEYKQKPKPKKKPIYKEIITHEEASSDEDEAPIIIRKVIKKPRKIKVLDTGLNEVEVIDKTPSKPIDIPKEEPQYKMSKYEYMKSYGF